MAKEIVIWCDVCLADTDERRHGTPISLSLNKMPARTIDLCEKHKETLVDPLWAHLTDLGVPIELEQAPRQRKNDTHDDIGEFFCPEPKCDKLYARRSSLQYHTEHTHGKLLAEYAGFGGPYQCSYCPASYVQPQGLSIHVNRRHSKETQPA